MTSNHGKEIQVFDNAHFICLMKALISSSKESDDSPIGFLRNFEARKRKLTNFISTVEIYHVRVHLQDEFGSLEHEENAENGLGYKSTLPGKNYNHVLREEVGTVAEKVALKGRVIFEVAWWFVPHYTPKTAQQYSVAELFISGAATQLT